MHACSRLPQPGRWPLATAAMLVLVAVLLLAGVADLEAPPLPDASAATCVSAPGPASAGSELGRAADDPEAVPTTSRVGPVAAEVASGVGLPRELEVHVKRAFCDRAPAYIGPLVVRANGRVLLTTVRKNQTPVVFEVPPGCGQVEFEAPEHAPAVFTVPEPSARPRPLHVVLQPSARLRIDASHREPLAPGSWELSVSTAHLDGATLVAPAADVPFVRGAAWRWRATLSLPAKPVVLCGEEPALASGEVRDLRLDFGAVVTQRFRVVGPSAELLPHLVLRHQWGEGERSDAIEVPLDATGVVTLVPLPGSRFQIGDVALRPRAVGAETELAPEQELVGIGLVDDSGAWLSSRAYDFGGRWLCREQSVHGFARAVAKLGLRLGSESRTAQLVPGSALTPGVDLVRVLRVPLVEPALGRLRVRVEGEPPSEPVRKGLRIEVRAADEAPVMKAVDEDLVFELPGDSVCRVAWAGHGEQTVIANACSVRAGATTELVAQWPVLEVWTGEVQGYAELPRQRLWQHVAWGEGTLWGRGAARLTPEGRFERCLAGGSELDTVWRLTWGIHTVPAVVVRSDAYTRHVVLAAEGASRWVAVEPDMEPPWFVGCCVDGGSPFLRLFARHDGLDSIPVVSGQTVRGALQGRLDGRQSTLAWWTFGDGTDRLVVRPASGRWIELRPSTACADRGAALVGPNGQWDLGYDLTAGTPLRVWVPDGTRCVVVFDGDRPRETARELPLGSADFVVVD